MTLSSFSLTGLAGAIGRPEGAALLEEFDAALSDPGAFRLIDVPAPADLVQQMHQVTCAFFQLPMVVKSSYRYVEDQYVGWCGGEFLAQYGSLDRKEMFHIGPRVAPTLGAHGSDGSLPSGPGDLRQEALSTCTLWPATPPGFIPVWHAYYRAMQEASVLLGRTLAHLLGTTEEAWFGVMGGNWADLAANYYPPLETDGETPVYNAAHRDLTVFTVLHQDQSPLGGLSVQSDDGNWHEVAPTPDSYVVNVGELLTYLSAGRWRAAPHQVTVSTEAAPGAPARISVPFFYRPSDRRVITSFVDPDVPPIAVGDWVLAKKRASSATA